MNVLFLVFSTFLSVKEKNAGIYADLVREFVNHGHKVYRMFPTDEEVNDSNRFFEEPGQYVVKTNVGRVRGNRNLIAKGFNMLLLEPKITNSIKKYFGDVRFDIVLYATPPITFYGAVKYIKKKDGAMCYLMLKDIFPQGAVDLGMLSKHGIKGLVYTMFRRKEKLLYSVSDYIGCMSEANINYVIQHNKFINKSKVELLPNSIEPIGMEGTEGERESTRDKYGIPHDKIAFVYGGNLGKPQGIPFVIEMLKQVNKRNSQDNILSKAFFIIVGNGSEYGLLQEYEELYKPDNLLLMERLSVEEYDRVVRSCDIGMIFLDYRFTIPNYPSRLMSYMQAKMPVICFTDSATDIGKKVIEKKFGWSGESKDADKAVMLLEKACKEYLSDQSGNLKNNAWKCLVEDFNVSNAYDTIIKRFDGLKKV